MTRTGSLALTLAALLALGNAIVPAEAAAARFALVETGAARPGNDAVQVRALGEREVWIGRPGIALAKTVGVRPLDLRDDEVLYVMEADAAHTVSAPAREVAAWPGYVLFAVPEGEPLTGPAHCLERLRWVGSPPLPTAAALERRADADPQLQSDIVDAVDLDRYTTIVRSLSGDLSLGSGRDAVTIRTRSTYSDGVDGGIDDAVDYIREQFVSAGYTPFEQAFSGPGGQTERNLIAIREGMTRPNDVVVIGAHYDSISEQQATLAPGAEDNASGTAAVIHLAEVFADVFTEQTLHFICFGAEEQGLYGSQFYVSQLASNGWTVTAALTMDMISAWATDYGILIEATSASLPLMEDLRDNVVALGELSWTFSLSPFGSDHIPFLQAGLPALLAIDLDADGEYPDYHLSTDTYDELDPTLGYEVARAMAATVVDRAGALGVVSVEDPDRPSGPRPRRLALAPPRPNPFNPRTTISFEAPQAGKASLRVFDARGRVVKTLVEADVAAGTTTAIWDGTDVNDDPVASGLYFVRLESRGKVRTERLTLVR